MGRHEDDHADESADPRAASETPSTRVERPGPPFDVARRTTGDGNACFSRRPAPAGIVNRPPAEPPSMISSEEMAVVDANAAALGVPRKQLMESSGNAVARVVREMVDPGDSVALVCGRGNNGGDAFVAARFLSSCDVTVHLLGRPETIGSDIARENWDALEADTVETRVVGDSADFTLGDPDLAVDAMLGTGVTGALREPEATVARALTDADAPVLAVDVPSGVDADTGETAGLAVEADAVVTFHDTKPGLDALDAEVTVADIGIPTAAEEFVARGDLLRLSRAENAHKGDHGEVLVVGGGPYTGAPALAARAAMRAGADLVRVVCPARIEREIQGYAAELIVHGFDADRLTPPVVDDLLNRAAVHDVVVFGPGLGSADATRDAVRGRRRRHRAPRRGRAGRRRRAVSVGRRRSRGR